MKRFVLVKQPGSTAAPQVIVDLEASYAGAGTILEPTVMCSGTSHDTLRRLTALMNEHWR